MQWSAVRDHARAFLADSLNRRVDYHASKYRGGGRAWIAVDGRDFLSVADEGRRWGAPFELGKHSLGDVLYAYPSLPMERILAHENPMVRALGMLDKRLGKRRLITLDVSEAHPLVRALYALRCEAEGLPAKEVSETLSIGATQIARRLKRAEARSRRLDKLADGVAAAAMLSARRRGEDPRGLIRAFMRGEAPGAPPATPIVRLLQEVLEHDDEPHELARVLKALAAHSKLFKRPEHVRGIVNLWRHRKDWLRPLETWTAPARSASRQFTSLAGHLMARKPVPAFMDGAWEDGDPAALAWYRHIAATGDISGAPGLPFPLTRAAARFFMAAPPHYSVGGALRWAQVRAAGGDHRAANGLLGTRLEREFGSEEFWAGVIAFFVRNPLLDPVHYGPIIDYLHHRRFERRRVFVAQGVVRELAPEQPRLTMRGRTVEALLRDVEAWHGRLGRESAASGLRWRPSGIPAFESVDGTAEARDMRLWRVRELLSGDALAEEGRAMQHCVASYARSCAEGASSIWALEVQAGGEVDKRLTLEVANARRELRQARGKCNRLPTPEENAVLRRWVVQAALRSILWAAACLSFMPRPASALGRFASGSESFDLAEAVVDEYAFVRDGDAWKKTAFICDLPAEVVWAVPAQSTSAFSVSRLKKAAPGGVVQEAFTAVEEPGCGMNQCDFKWAQSKTGAQLAVHEMHYRDPEQGDWTAGYRLAEGGGGRPAWKSCAAGKFLNLFCVTKRRSVFITRDAEGRAFYRTANFDSRGGKGVELAAPPSTVSRTADGQRFDFTRGEYAYGVEVSTGSAFGAKVVVREKGRQVQSEDCLGFVWADVRAAPAP